MAKLTKDGIVTAAFTLLAEGGLGAITARALADRLGVRAGALYYHLPDMSALADEMATVMMREVIAGRDIAVTSSSNWQQFLRGSAAHLRDVLLRYRDGARLFSGTYLTDDEAIGSMELPLRHLTDAGFELEEALRAMQTLTAFVTGSVIEEQHRLAAPERYTAARRHQRVDAERFPLTDAASDTFIESREATFTWGVDVLIAGLASRKGRQA
ncbi:TetR family transcriptional regulator [Rathayibacter sp. PhB152]|uniref:TetR/AcrR family transcriptional regulator C-terminal domain-containing protein n=1 Tax=Rathayibacter sp. PhB152 TaxID=2485190 RepID=UPI000F4CF600|nr:TetR/AcrR family transcriptional regulator C-terminal domain-containing protein [Rathayibacter sp. PhB152]ROQ59096.1 TetR family transcriptional regulator [Rathayibacter sp. PhB152]